MHFCIPEWLGDCIYLLATRFWRHCCCIRNNYRNEHSASTFRKVIQIISVAGIAPRLLYKYCVSRKASTYAHILIQYWFSACGVHLSMLTTTPSPFSSPSSTSSFLGRLSFVVFVHFYSLCTLCPKCMCVCVQFRSALVRFACWWVDLYAWHTLEAC